MCLFRRFDRWRPSSTNSTALATMAGPLEDSPSNSASTAGFDKPILHGLCTYGFTGRALLHALCGSDPARFGGMGGRFKSPVVPGETLEVHAWEDDGRVIFQTRVGDRVVFDNGVMTQS